MSSEESALRDNISRKGKNSYYFAHDKTPNGPIWDGKEEPLLLATESVEPTKVSYKTLNEYSWCDGTKNVTIYVEWDMNEVDRESAKVVNTASGIEFSFANTTGKAFKLIIDPLCEEIEE